MLRRACSTLGESPHPFPGTDWLASTSLGKATYIPGPYILGLPEPPTHSTESRISSAVNRRISNRENKSFAGSAFRASAVGVAEA